MVKAETQLTIKTFYQRSNPISIKLNFLKLFVVEVAEEQNLYKDTQIQKMGTMQLLNKEL